jgi:POT family proton-dependent oligopeptide transporter
VGVSAKWQEIRGGFQRAFWIANGTELFERLAYYGPQAVLAVYLTEGLHFSSVQAGQLIGLYGFVVWFLPIIGGALADRFGFRRTLAAAYLILAIGYFLLGSLSAPFMEPLRSAVPLYWLVLLVMMVPALGPAVVKPVVAGTTARASTENVRSLGYSIYYTVVNVGGTLGPLMAYQVRTTLGVEAVFRVSAAFMLAMFVCTLVFYREPGQATDGPPRSIGQSVRNLALVLADVRFMAFLVVFSGFYVVFWQQYVSLPLFIRGYVNRDANVDLLLTVDPATVIAFTFLVNYLMRKVKAFPAMTAGVLVSGLGWLFLTLGGSTPLVVAALFTVAIGEVMLAPRLYEYCSKLAPPDQQGMFMGFAFLPVAIGYFIAGPLGGWLVRHYGEELHAPNRMWFVVTGIGLLTTVLMVAYDRLIGPQTRAPEAPVP